MVLGRRIGEASNYGAFIRIGIECIAALPVCPNPCCDCGESWIGLLRELELLRSPLTFDQLIGDRVEYVDGDLAKITSSPPPESFCDPVEDEWPGYPNTAICSNHIMRSGKHYATFSMKGESILAYIH